jgi:hypothetical protein
MPLEGTTSGDERGLAVPTLWLLLWLLLLLLLVVVLLLR